jgi:two-component system, NtrC family, sensor kinase
MLEPPQPYSSIVYPAVDRDLMGRFYAATEQPMVVIGVNDVEKFYYVDWNPAAAAAAGLSCEAIVGQTPEQVHGEAEGQRERQLLQACLATGTSQKTEVCRRWRDQQRWWMTTYTPLRNAAGTIAQIIGTATDITDQKVTADRLRNDADRQVLLNRLSNQIRHSLDLNTVIQTALQIIHQRLQPSHCAFGWIDCNSKPIMWDIVQEIKPETSVTGIGKLPETLIGPITQQLLAQDIICINDVEQHAEPIHRSLLKGFGIRAEAIKPIRTNSGSMGALLCCHTQPHDWQAEEIELFALIADQVAIAIDQAQLYTDIQQKSETLKQTLKELQQTQAQIIQSEKMSSLGQLVAGIAHEINNPVNFIQGNVSYTETYTQSLIELLHLYQQECPHPSPMITDKLADIDWEFMQADLPRLVQSMRDGTDRISEIVKSLRSFSRLDEAEVQSVDIHEGIDSTLMILESRIRAKHGRQTIQIEKNYGNLPPLYCLAGQLNQVFMNLLANAIDAIDERNVMRSWEDQCQQPSWIKITTAIVEQQAIIRIQDNGIGIPKEIQYRIFDPFYSTKPIGKGTGMGLPISYQIITEKHGGQLICHSRRGQGSEFIIQIPVI